MHPDRARDYSNVCSTILVDFLRGPDLLYEGVPNERTDDRSQSRDRPPTVPLSQTVVYLERHPDELIEYHQPKGVSFTTLSLTVRLQ